MNSQLTVFLAWGVLWLTNWQPITFQFQYITYQCFVNVAHTLVLLFSFSNWRLTKFLPLSLRHKNYSVMFRKQVVTLDSTWDVKAGPLGERPWRPSSGKNIMLLLHFVVCSSWLTLYIAYWVKPLMRVVRSKLLSYGTRGAAELDEKTLVLSPWVTPYTHIPAVLWLTGSHYAPTARKNFTERNRV